MLTLISTQYLRQYQKPGLLELCDKLCCHLRHWLVHIGYPANRISVSTSGSPLTVTVSCPVGAAVRASMYGALPTPTPHWSKRTAVLARSVATFTQAVVQIQLYRSIISELEFKGFVAMLKHAKTGTREAPRGWVRALWTLPLLRQ